MMYKPNLTHYIFQTEQSEVSINYSNNKKGLIIKDKIFDFKLLNKKKLFTKLTDNLIISKYK